jgi:CubicO group peptidase (beta-lactamase class C family)
MLVGWVAAVSGTVAAQSSPGKEPGVQRAEAFLEIVHAPADKQREFVERNFTAEAIARRGLDGLAKFLDEQVRNDLGDTRPSEVEAHPEFVVLVIKDASGAPLRFSVLLSPAPESKIRGFVLGTPDDAPPPAPVVKEEELPKVIADLVAIAAGKGFTGQVLVARNGEELFAHAYGEADRTTHRPISLDTPINLASNNKMFTALLIAQLVEEGKLGWDDKVGKYLPDWPNADVREKVTIAHLLTHTSGLGEYWGDAHQAKLGTLDTVAEYADLFRDDKPAATPGVDFKYSNNGYVLLGLIAEKVTGRDYYELVRERIYARAGMTHTDHYLNTDSAHGLAIGYLADGSSSAGRLALRGSPAGGGYASARDLLAFANALREGKLVKPETLARMTTGIAPMGPDMAYGYGFGVTSKPEKHYGHDGGTPGTNSSFEVFPDSGYVVIVQSNTGQGSQPLARQLISLIENRKKH